MRKLLLLLLVLCAPALAQAPERWAVCVGIDRFDDKVFHPLSCASADAELLARTLRETGGFRPDNVFLLTSRSTSPNEQPTRANILSTFNRLANAMQPQDSLVVFFASHGIEVEKKHYIITQDTDSAHVGESAISTAQLQEKVADSKAGNVIMAIDCCRERVTQEQLLASRGLSTGQSENGKMTESLAADLAFRPSRQGQVVATLFACSPSERSWEWRDKGHGYFTYYLVEGLRGKAAREDGMVRLTDLVGYLETEVPRTVRLNEKGEQQVPWMQSQGTGLSSLIVAVPGKGNRPAPTPAPAPAPAPQPPQERSSDTRPAPAPAPAPAPSPAPPAFDSAVGAASSGTLALAEQSNPYGVQLDAYAERGAEYTNMRVRLQNSTGQGLDAPIAIRLYLRRANDRDWQLAREWTDIARIPPNYRISRDYLARPADHPCLLEGRFEMKVTVTTNLGETSREGLFTGKHATH